jgi:IclR family acetate operon transcriptional repressor
MAHVKEESGKRSRGRPRAFHDRAEANTIQSLDRALAILESLAGADGASLSELSERAGQSPATTYRVLSTFLLHDMVSFDKEMQLWHVGPGAFRIGSVFLSRTNILAATRPIMQRLMRLTGETANLGIERDGRVMFISQVETPQTIRAFFAPGTLSPMHASGIGKVLLAHYPAERVEAIIERHGMQGFTPRTLTDRAQLFDELAGIRERGFGVDDEEAAEGMRCVASPVKNAYGEPVAGLSVSGPGFRLTRPRIAEVGASVASLAAEATKAMGG